MVVGAKGNLKGADLVDNVPVHTDGVGRRGEDVDLLLLHDIARHVVGDHGDVDALVTGDRRRQPRTLQIGARFGADEFDVVASFGRLPQHGAHDGLGKALGHDRPLPGEVVDQRHRRVG